MEDKKENKEWTTAAQFSSYEEADNFRNELVSKHELVKVRRGANTYRVKVWDPPPLKKEEIKKVKNKLKKGDNSTRRRKNDNKKVRYRPKQS
tara:strand:+ start:2230 stop:2505 length:276 start_codon:yes stop_codon:yes gene_type:complete